MNIAAYLDKHLPRDLITTRLRDLPNWISMVRIGLIPLICFLVAADTAWCSWLAFFFFLIAAGSDWLDGWLARNYELESRFGQMIDSIADKLLVAAMIIILVFVNNITGWSIAAALIISVREIAVAGLREFLGAVQMSMPSSQLGKLKAVVQFIALGLLILGDHGPALAMTRIFGELLLWLAAILSAVSGYEYGKAGWEQFKKGEKQR